MYKKYIKRFFDIILSLFALIVLAIPLGIVLIMVYMDVGSPVIFKQKRIGYRNKEYNLLKFRTMSEARNKDGIYLPDEDRITKLGKILRKLSIDELPSLINILKGEMSIIGPRPLPVRYLDRYTTEQLRRHEVLPGLSNVSAISGRNLLSWEDKFEMDVWYVDHLSFLTDLKILFGTFKVLFSKKGAVSDDDGARTEFLGTKTIEEVLQSNDKNYMKIDRREDNGNKD